MKAPFRSKDGTAPGNGAPGGEPGSAQSEVARSERRRNLLLAAGLVAVIIGCLDAIIGDRVSREAVPRTRLPGAESNEHFFAGPAAVREVERGQTTGYFRPGLPTNPATSVRWVQVEWKASRKQLFSEAIRAGAAESAPPAESSPDTSATTIIMRALPEGQRTRLYYMKWPDGTRREVPETDYELLTRPRFLDLIETTAPAPRE